MKNLKLEIQFSKRNVINVINLHESNSHNETGRASCRVGQDCKINGIQHDNRIMNEKIVAAIGNPTSRTLSEMGVKVKIVPEHYTFEELLRVCIK